jgi:hypothetical protein
MKQITTFICLGLLAGCNATVDEPSAGNPVSHIITEQEARQIASEHANAFLKDKTFGIDGGERHPFPALPPTTWHGVTKTTNGWTLFCEPPSGPYAHVEMDLNGENAKLTKYGFSAD